MKVEIVSVTPHLASEWLRFNVDNRTLRRTTVETLKGAFQRGEYKQTHQGIAFSETGRLLDGQHRLTAISELRDGVFPMVVTWGLPDDAFGAIDVGLKRTAADVTGLDRRLVEEARFIGETCRVTRASITIPQIARIAAHIQPSHESLIHFCGTTSKTWGSVGVRTAAVVRMMTGGDPDYVKTQYRALVLADYGAMVPAAHAICKQNANGALSPSDRLDMFARAMVVFDASKANITRIQIADTAVAASFVRDHFQFLMEGAQEKAANEVAAKDVLRRHSNESSNLAQRRLHA